MDETWLKEWIKKYRSAPVLSWEKDMQAALRAGYAKAVEDAARVCEDRGIGPFTPGAIRALTPDQGEGR